MMERSDLTSLTNTLAGGVNTLLALLPVILLFKGAFILGSFSPSQSPHCSVPSSLGLIVKDKVGHLLPARIYTETLPSYSISTSSNNNMFYNTRDHSSLHDLVPPHSINNNNNNYESVGVSSPSSSSSSYTRHKRRLSAGSGWGASQVSDMVAVAAGAPPYTIETQRVTSRDQPKTYQRLIKLVEMEQPREEAPSFWESFINIRRLKNFE